MYLIAFIAKKKQRGESLNEEQEKKILRKLEVQKELQAATKTTSAPEKTSVFYLSSYT